MTTIPTPASLSLVPALRRLGKTGGLDAGLAIPITEAYLKCAFKDALARVCAILAMSMVGTCVSISLGDGRKPAAVPRLPRGDGSRVRFNQLGPADEFSS